MAESLIVSHEDAGADFSGYLGPPLGTGIELTESESILAADKEASLPYEREHVSPFLYHRPDRFRIHRPWAPEELCLPEAKVTLDTREDYEYIKRIYRAMYTGTPIEVLPLVQWLKDELIAHGPKHESEKKNHTAFTVGKTG
jgi:spore coat polysaccharide biosynthesis protein SpsF